MQLRLFKRELDEEDWKSFGLRPAVPEEVRALLFGLCVVSSFAFQSTVSRVWC
jgi:hypothetical protein